MGGFVLSGRLLRWVKSVGEAWEIESHIWGPFIYSIFAFSVSCFVLNCLRIFLNCAFYEFYKENQGLEVPRETRLEKLMRLLEASKKMHGGKADLSTIWYLNLSLFVLLLFRCS